MTDDPLIDDEAPDHGLLVGDEAPDHGLLVDDEAPDHGLLVDDEAPDHGLLVDDEAPDHGLLVGDEAPEYGLVRSATMTTLRLPAWMFLYTSLTLLGWVLLTTLSTPWQPTVVTSASMAPSVRVGDVVFLAAPEPGDVAQRSIVGFSDERGERVLHRVFSVEDGFYVTKGDANPTPDTERLSYERIDGVGRMVVPYAGLPLVWWIGGHHLQFWSWLGLTIIALVLAARQFEQRERSPTDDGAKSPVAQIAIRQVRVLVALMVMAQYVVDPVRFTVDRSAIPPILVMVVTVAVLALTNLLSIRADRTGDLMLVNRASRLGLAVDTLLVVAMVTATGSSGIGWVLFALPIIEAAARFRLTGALAVWMSLTLSTIGLRIALATRNGTTSAVLLDDLDAVMDQLSVLLLITVPGAYLAEQLLTDVVENRRATSTARNHSTLLRQVVDHGRKVTQLDRSLFDTLIVAIESLGFVGADVVVRLDRAGPWQVLATSEVLRSRPVPEPGGAGSALADEDLAAEAVYIDGFDPSHADAAALASTGWSTLVRMLVPTADGTAVAVRATLDETRQLDPDAIDGLSLLLGQASVGLQNNQLLNELRDMNQRMKHASTHDALTGLPNRVLVMDGLAEALPAAGPASATAVLFLDLNGFKPVNDRLGHDSGDELLRMVSSRLINQVGDRGQVGRLGGDEFTIVTTGLMTPAGAEDLANRACAAIAEPFTLGSDPVRISATIGISYAEAPVEPAELLRRADVAMYRAKTEPNVRIRHYEAAMDQAEIRTARLTGELAAAVRLGQVQMHFQPVVEEWSGSIVGAESLIRWQHPELGPVAPGDLIAMAEQSGRAAEMNRWILDESLQAARKILPHAERDSFFIAINASPTEIRLPSFVDHVIEALELAGVPAGNVLIELSERLVLDDDPVVPTNIERLADIGVRVLLDDFGEGTTSLGHIRRLPLAGLKLDRSFLVHSDTEPADEIIIRSLVMMAHDLGISVIAEGVEHAGHREIAARAGVDMVQGYSCGRPMPLTDLLDFMDQAAGRGSESQASAPTGRGR